MTIPDRLIELERAAVDAMAALAQATSSEESDRLRALAVDAAAAAQAAITEFAEEDPDRNRMKVEAEVKRLVRHPETP
ncbi:hypothetical protein B591_30538 (plasmid) [Streptomyces sp. GBA 94-10 4N24]|uniref:hypothetical protein n=1 Tax=Streptomyces TaxID=1883 RepID=UPI0003C2CB48|nr:MULTISPECIES: hypothetical protein [Streptomyces]ESP95627.1 hypothetical protein B591_30538 [Streptomyces sp. GBA 94-10 4N24]MCG5119599.1 hypothetical protein [Streptomyces sp. T7(2022)]RZE74556.1 hypothetical protein C0Q99_19555 [Streptomyces albidoflavus]UZN63089.1 hypothetical protein B591N_30538 [Streptomyces sp. GBA 94-10 4N24]WSD51235.1 hypothetical protein OHA76_00180 [Streptomyces albidoflavus]